MAASARMHGRGPARHSRTQPRSPVSFSPRKPWLSSFPSPRLQSRPVATAAWTADTKTAKRRHPSQRCSANKKGPSFGLEPFSSDGQFGIPRLIWIAVTSGDFTNESEFWPWPSFGIADDTGGDRIRKHRLDIKLLQKQVAEQIGVESATIASCERNAAFGRSPTSEALVDCGPAKRRCTGETWFNFPQTPARSPMPGNHLDSRAVRALCVHTPIHKAHFRDQVVVAKLGPPRLGIRHSRGGAEINISSAEIDGNGNRGRSDLTRDSAFYLDSCLAPLIAYFGTSMTPSCAIIVARFQFAWDSAIFETLEPIDGSAVDGDLALGGLHAEELSFVGSADSPVEDHFIAFSDGVVDGEFQVGKCLAAALDVVFDVLYSGVLVGEDWIVETDLVGEEFGDLVEVTLVPELFHKPLDDLLVQFGCLVLLGHRPPSFPWARIDPTL